MFDGSEIHSALWATAQTRDLLTELRAERALAALDGLDDDPAYMADLDEEITATEHAYVEAAVGEIARLRAELSGELRG